MTLLAAFSGSVLAGLFGSGAGLIFTPAIFLFLSHNNPQADYLMQTSITTMIAAMLPAGLVACLKQYRYCHIDWQAIRWSTLYIVIGCVSGCFIMMWLSSKILVYFFAIATLLLALRSGLKLIHSSSHTVSKCANNKALRLVSSFLLGVISAVSGSGSFTVPFYQYFGLSIKAAIGTTTVVVWLYSVVIVIIMMVLGFNKPDLPLGNIGYLNYHYLGLFMLPTIPGTLLGVKWSHCLAEQTLKVIFTVLLVIIGIVMLCA